MQQPPSQKTSEPSEIDPATTEHLIPEDTTQAASKAVDSTQEEKKDMDTTSTGAYQQAPAAAAGSHLEHPAEPVQQPPSQKTSEPSEIDPATKQHLPANLPSQHNSDPPPTYLASTARGTKQNTTQEAGGRGRRKGKGYSHPKTSASNEKVWPNCPQPKAVAGTSLEAKPQAPIAAVQLHLEHSLELQHRTSQQKSEPPDQPQAAASGSSLGLKTERSPSPKEVPRRARRVEPSHGKVKVKKEKDDRSVTRPQQEQQQRANQESHLTATVKREAHIPPTPNGIRVVTPFRGKRQQQQHDKAAKRKRLRQDMQTEPEAKEQTEGWKALQELKQQVHAQQRESESDTIQPATSSENIADTSTACTHSRSPTPAPVEQEEVGTPLDERVKCLMLQEGAWKQFVKDGSGWILRSYALRKLPYAQTFYIVVIPGTGCNCLFVGKLEVDDCKEAPN